MKTLLLTWWTWYIGSHNAVLLLEQWYNIIIFDNLSNSSRYILKSIQQIVTASSLNQVGIEVGELKFYKWDLRNKNDLNIVFSENTIDTVIHFAGLKAVWESCEKPQEYYENNVVGSMNLFSMMEQYNCKNIIFSSSATVYEPTQTPPFSENTLTGNTTNPYGTSKFIIENILRDLAHHKDFKVINLRYFNPIGAHSSWLIGEDPSDIPNNLLPYIMKVATGELQSLWVYGNDYDTIDWTGIRDYIHVVDLAAWHLSALNFLSQQQDSIFETFNLWTWTGTSVMEMIQYTQDIIWEDLSYNIISRRDGDIASAYCSPQKAQNILWWKAKKTVQDAITDSWNFIKNKKY